MTTPALPNAQHLYQEQAHLLDQAALEPQHHTDLGNALRLVALHGNDFRNCVDRLFFWMEARWVPEVPGAMHRFAKDVILSLYNDAALLQAEAATSPDLIPEERSQLSKQAEATARWARTSENQARINAMIGLAKNEESVQIGAKAWDLDQWLLNTPAGTLDLRTSTLRPHDRADYITMMTVASYDPQAGYLPWDDFLARIMPDPTLRSYLQRSLGYSVTGITTEEKLFMPWGPPATGKSTLLRAVGTCLGDYAVVVGGETFGEQKSDGNAPRNDVARLVGKRFVLAMELPGNQRLATGLLQRMTGGDVMVTRFNYQEFFEFLPTGKIWLTSNSRPIIPDNEPGMWRRVSQVPFQVVIPEPERDPDLKIALMDPDFGGTAVLRWLVEGCASWQQLGLNAPQVVQRASASYRQEMDRLAGFIEDVCFVEENATCTNSTIYAAYQQWCQQNGERTISHKGFTQRLEAKGYTRLRAHEGVRQWRGIGLQADGYRQGQLS
jgi:putative DNA primase/helicase